MPFLVFKTYYGCPNYEIDWREPGPRRLEQRLGREVHRVEISEALALMGLDNVLAVARRTGGGGDGH